MKAVKDKKISNSNLFELPVNSIQTVTPKKMELDIVQEVQILGCQKYKVLTIHNSQASEGAIHITLEQKPTDALY